MREYEVWSARSYGRMTSIRRFAVLCCALATVVVHADQFRLYVTATSDPPDAWERDSQIRFDPSCDPCNCNITDGPYAATRTTSTESPLTGTQFGVAPGYGNFVLPAGHCITQVRVNVMCRYNDGFAGHILLNVLVPGFVSSDRVNSSPFTSGTNCEWRLNATQADITDILDWNANPNWINEIQLYVRRISTPSAHGPLRVKAMRIIVDTALQDADSDGVADCVDPDIDNDGRPNAQDPQPSNRFVCGSTDGDTCDDCAVAGVVSPNNDGLDTDADGLCNASDPDDDNDGRLDGSDPQPLNRFVCGSTDGDSCDDCGVAGFVSPSNDGLDTDGDGQCNASDPDDDNDGRLDGSDPQPLNRFVCGSTDGDTCDDCGVVGVVSPLNDGPDTDQDGDCNASDNCPTTYNPSQTDCNGNGIGDACDPSSGPDTDGDGTPNACDTDDDADGVADTNDSAPLDRFRCSDVDGDLCDDCSFGFFDPWNDGPDADLDGICDSGDVCPQGTDSDGDGICDNADNCPFVPNPDQFDCNQNGIGDICEGGDFYYDHCNCTYTIREGTSEHIGLQTATRTTQSIGCFSSEVDIWFKYWASETGIATILLDTNFIDQSVILGVYDACGGPLLACDSGLGGFGVDKARVQIPVVAGRVYALRCGSPNPGIYVYVDVDVQSYSTPTFTMQPLSAELCAGTRVHFSVSASGVPAPVHANYRWQRDSVDIPGAIGPDLIRNAVTPADAGTYRCIVTTLAGSTSSAPARLVVYGTCVRPQFVEMQSVGFTAQRPIWVAAARTDLRHQHQEIAVALNAASVAAVLARDSNGSFSPVTIAMGGPQTRVSAKANTFAVAHSQGVATMARVGGSSFVPVAVPGMQGAFAGVTISDFNGRGALDIASIDAPGSGQPAELFWRLGDGSGSNCNGATLIRGSVQGSTEYPMLAPTVGVRFSDLVIAEPTGNMIRWRRSLGESLTSGSGGCQENWDFQGWDDGVTRPVGTNPGDVFVAELDVPGLSGAPDIIVANRGGNSLTLLFGPDYTLATTLAVGMAPQCVIAADFDGDGLNDIAASNRDSDSVSLFLNLGGRAFSPLDPILLHGGSAPFGITAGDFDGDGRVDLAIACFDSNEVVLMRNDINPPGTCAGDLNGDNDVDLQDLASLLANFGVTSGATRAQGDVDGDRDVDLSDLSAVLSAFGSSCIEPPICPGDLNGDNVVDLVDLSRLLTNFGAPNGVSRANGDADGDGDVDLADLSIVLSLFGSRC